MLNIATDRHPGVQHFRGLFNYEHLSEDAQRYSRPFAELAQFLVDNCKDGAELTTALRKILEAKDAAVRQALLDQGILKR